MEMESKIDKQTEHESEKSPSEKLWMNRVREEGREKHKQKHVRKGSELFPPKLGFLRWQIYDRQIRFYFNTNNSNEAFGNRARLTSIHINLTSLDIFYPNSPWIFKLCMNVSAQLALRAK